MRGRRPERVRASICPRRRANRRGRGRVLRGRRASPQPCSRGVAGRAAGCRGRSPHYQRLPSP
eukprot:7567754-Alexandrium_andersonii.AAC.1